MGTPVKLYPPIKKQLVSSLSYLFENKSSASKVIQYSFKSNKKWGSRDRKAFAEGFYFLVREAGPYFNKIGKKDFTSLSEEEAEKIVTLYQEGFDPKEPEDFCMKKTMSSDLNEVLEKELPLVKEEFLRESQKTAPVFLRVNTLKTNDQECKKALNEEGTESELIKENCLMLIERKNVFTSDTFKKGFFEIQDGASQDVAPFLQVSKGQRVADSCSGAGGKALHIAAKLENTGTLIAMDIFPRRLEELKKRAKRAGVSNIEIKPLVGTKTIKRMEGKFDRVLLDVPCTGSGTYRRKPESKIFFSKEEHQRLLETQKEILNLHARLVKPGGKLVYATCSVLPSENSEQVKSFLAENDSFELEEEKSNQVGKDRFDGFYMARLLKK